jgi:3-keto-disaccharide hydrolase
MQRLVLLAAFAVALPAAVFAAPAPNTLTPQERAAGWNLLFDGKSFDGWDYPASTTPPSGAWSIEDGCLRGNAHPAWNEYLLTKEPFRNFELAFEWRVAAGGNSGVKYLVQRRELSVDRKRIQRSELRPGMKAEEWIAGFEYQIIDDQRHADAGDPSHRTGALYDLIQPASAVAHPVGEFNESRLVVRGGHFEHWLNGVKVMDVDLNSPAFQEHMKERWATRRPGSLRELTHPARVDCPIALQDHGEAPVWFRSIKIRRLD